MDQDEHPSFVPWALREHTECETVVELKIEQLSIKNISDLKKYLLNPQWARVQAYSEPKPPGSCSAVVGLGFQMNHSYKNIRFTVQINNNSMAEECTGHNL